MNRESVIKRECDLHKVDGIIRSKSFERSRSMRALLVYLWQHRGGSINEYAIATEALGRPADFDSKIDATVRVQIGRLRRALDKYYLDEGRFEPCRLTIPTGSHELQIINVETSIDVGGSEHLVSGDTPLRTSTEARRTTSTDRSRFLYPAAIAGVVMGAAFTFALLWAGILPRRLTQASEKIDTPLFWKSIAGNSKTTRIVLPAPTFFSWEASPGHSVMVRDIAVNSPDQWGSSAVISKLVEEQLGQPRTWHGYTVASDTFAAVQLARFLDRYGIQTTFSSSANSPQEIIDHENIVTFGTASSLSTFQSDLDRLTFKMAIHEARVVDLLNSPNHPREFSLVHESAERDVAPGIVAVIPKGTSGGRLMLVQGSQTMAIISYLTSEEGMKEVGQALQAIKTPYFEAVILSEVSRGTPLQSRLGAIREFSDRALPSNNTSQLTQKSK